MPKSTEKTPTFEESMASLEKIVQAVESGQIGLEESLARYEQGMQLIKRCRQMLDNAEKRIEVLSQEEDGLTAKPLDSEALRLAAAGTAPSADAPEQAAREE